MANELKTDVELQKDPKIVKSGEEISSLELSTFGNKSKFNGDLDVHGDIGTIDHNSRVRTFKIESLDALRIATHRSDAKAVASNNEITISTDSNINQIRLNTEGHGSTVRYATIATTAGGSMDIFNSSDEADTGEGVVQISAINTGDATKGWLVLSSTGYTRIDSGDTLQLDANTATEGNGIQLKLAGTQVGDVTGHSSATQFRLYENIGASTDDYFNIAVAANGATTITTVDDASVNASLAITPDGSLTLNSGGTKNIILAAGALGCVEFDGCSAGFDLGATTYDATDTFVRFDQGNKQTLTFGSGNITNLWLRFPTASGNFTLILKQDGSGSRTVTNWKALDYAATGASGSLTVKFAGGSNPTLTTDANHVDIISFFWDADAEIAYGVASLDFQF